MSLSLIETLSQGSELAAPSGDTLDTTPILTLLETGRLRAANHNLPYAGALLPNEAWSVVSRGGARLVDVRTVEETVYVGRVPDSLHVPWQTGTSMTKNPRFVRELEAKLQKNEPVILLCRSGQRSAAAAEAATRAGFTQVFNVLEGFEGDLDEKGHRGSRGGWRVRGLPWLQS